jgi:hypothetical protein
MKLYAQHGHATQDKIGKGIQEGFIDGAILSSRYLKPDPTKDLIDELRAINPDIDILVDPEFYATRYLGTPNSQLRYLQEWPHFVPRQRNELLVGTNAIDTTLERAYKTQMGLGSTALISPNIYVSSSFDSIEAAIAISFFSRAKTIAAEMGIAMPVYATVAVGRDALIDKREYVTFLNAITSVEPAPDGVYVLVGAGPTDERSGTVRSEIVIPEVIAGWMLMNYSLALNGLLVVNGYSDILTPMLGIAGGYAGATGWWSNLQVFSMGRYVKGSGGGRLPLIRYLSTTLLNRITISERQAFAEVVPDVVNALGTDALYERKEPGRTQEALQAWDAIASLNKDIIQDDMNEGLKRMQERIVRAKICYDTLQSYGLTDNYEVNIDYLTNLSQSLIAFKELAEL